MSQPYEGDSAKKNVPGLTGTNSKGGIGVLGDSATGQGVAGQSKSFQGVYGHSETNAGVVGESDGMDGVWGDSHAQGFSGVSGRNSHPQGGNGVWGSSDAGRGVAGFSKSWQGVYGHSETNAGVVGESDQFDGVFGVSHSREHAGVSGHNDRGGFAGYFEGKVTVDGALTVTDDIVLTGADCAERFALCPEAQRDPGTVMVIDADGRLRECREPYDRRVAGVISGAGEYRPAIVLGAGEVARDAAPLAMIGKVYCKVDAGGEPIDVGDLLTTSDTPGHAMKAADGSKAFGSIIGKALRPISGGRGLIPILVAMQ
jgi:hypothetical protein